MELAATLLVFALIFLGVDSKIVSEDEDDDNAVVVVVVENDGGNDVADAVAVLNMLSSTGSKDEDEKSDCG